MGDFGPGSESGAQDCAIVVEPDGGGNYAVTIRPLLSRPGLDRRFPIAGDALDYADLVAGEIAADVIDRTGIEL